MRRLGFDVGFRNTYTWNHNRDRQKTKSKYFPSRSFQELSISVTKLGDRVAPWLKIRLSGAPTISKIITAVDKLVYDDGVSTDKVNSLICNKYIKSYSTNNCEFIFIRWIPIFVVFIGYNKPRN
jgi:hypothetical protein